jgi:hypothetical protein
MIKKEISLASQSSVDVGESFLTVRITQDSGSAHSMHDNAHSKTAADIHATRDTPSLTENSKKATPE